MNSHLLPLFIFYRSCGEKLIKHQANSSWVIMSVILMTTLFYKALILQGKIWYWSLLGLKGLSKLESFCDYADLDVNMDKTKVMIFSDCRKSSNNYSFRCGANKIENVKSSISDWADTAEILISLGVEKGYIMYILHTSILKRNMGYWL